MIGLKVIAILFVSIVLCSSNEGQPEAQERISRFLTPPDKTVLEKSQPYVKRSLNDNTSFMSKLAGWLNPFGDSSSSSSKDQDLPAQEIRHAPPQYLPPPPHPIRYTHQSREACNPCNKEPWIPVASTYGKETIIGFIQPSEIGLQNPHINNGGIAPSTLEFLHPPPSEGNHLQSSGHQQVGLNQQYYGLTLPQTPPKQFISPPSQEYGPANQQYGPPVVDHHVDGSQNPQQYGPPKQEPNPPFLYLPPGGYGPPNNFVSPPKQEYGAPFDNAHGLPPQYLGPPPETPQKIYGPPAPEYGTPKHIGAQNNHDQFGVPNKPVETKYLPPTNFRPPAFPNQFGDHRPKFGPPRFRPRQNGKPSYKPRLPIQPDVRPPLEMRPPPLNGFITNYGGVPQPNKNYIFSTLPSSGPPFNFQTLPSVIPSDSYGAPVTGSDLDYGLSASPPGDRHYLSPLSLLPLAPNSNSEIQISPSIQIPVFDEILLAQKPIALPNLSQYPIVPIYDAKEFRQNFANSENIQVHHNSVEIKNTKPTEIPHEIITVSAVQPTYSHQSDNKNVQIVPSISVASFLSSIEHPINLIQSPIVEVTSNSSGGYQDLAETTKLSKYPIVVQHSGDSDVSASAENATYQTSTPNYQRNNDKSLAHDSTVSIEKVVPNTDFINYLLAETNNTISDLISFKPSGNLTQNPTEFTAPALDYSDWSPALNTISTSMVPPPVNGELLWISSAGGVGEQIITTTNKPKRIQIIIPYTTNNKPAPFGEIFTKQPDLLGTQGRKTPEIQDFEPKLSLYTQPPSSESVWLQHVNDYNPDESREVTKAYADATKSVINIKDLLKMEVDKTHYQNLPYDIITLQKNIDGWTEQEYSQKVNRGLAEYQKVSTTAQLVPSKKIPDRYLTTNSINLTETTTLRYPFEFYDHEPAGSNSKESKFNDFENIILADVTVIPETSAPTTELPVTTKHVWDTKQVSVSSLTREKIYVVTPETSRQGVSTTTPSTVAFSHPPKIGTKNYVTNSPSIVFSSPALGISLKPGQDVKSDLDDNVRIIFSEWPHLINKLETTTTEKPATGHPLFGLMDLSSYVPPANSSIQTYSGHSKVVTIVTPVSVSKNKEDNSQT